MRFLLVSTTLVDIILSNFHEEWILMKDKISHANQLVGTSWHVETLHKDEFDDRRHKSRCEWYDKNHCHYRSSKCIGLAHCLQYVESENNGDNRIGKVTTRAKQGSTGMDSKVKAFN